MTHVSHLLIGALTGALSPACIIFSISGALAPDVDVIWTLRGNLFKIGPDLLCRHRGITHHLLLWVGLVICAILSNQHWLYAFSLGGLSHLLADSLSPSGIPYWKNKHRIRFGVYKTRSLMEGLVLLCFIGSAAGVMEFRHLTLDWIARAQTNELRTVVLEFQRLLFFFQS